MNRLAFVTVLGAAALICVWVVLFALLVGEPEAPAVVTRPVSLVSQPQAEHPQSDAVSKQPLIAKLSSRVAELEKQLSNCRSKKAVPAVTPTAPATRTPVTAPATRKVKALPPTTKAPKPTAIISKAVKQGTIPVLVFTYNRPERLETCLNQLSRVMPRHQFDLFVSQDGDSVPRVKAVIEAFQGAHPDMSVTRILHTRDDSGATAEEIDQGWQAYYAIAHHYQSSINKVFSTNPHYQRIVLLEDDLEVAPDFFALMNATAPVFDRDPKLYCVSGFNDNGTPEHVMDPNVLYRSDFFPGLGWMTSRTVWDELNAIWPKGFWDDWMRQPDKRKGRACLRPEVPRSVARCSDLSASGGQFCEHLERMQLSEVAVDWASVSMDQFLPKSYDAYLDRIVRQATPLRTVFEIESLPSTVGEAKISYGSNDELVALEEQLGVMTDMKDGIPRTAYRGIITLRFKGKRLHLVPLRELYVYS